MLTSSLPFSNKTEILNGNWNEGVNYQMLSKYSESCINFLSHLLECDVEKRYNAYEALKDTWILKAQN